MNSSLRCKMQGIIERLLNEKAVTEAEIKLVRRSLLLAEVTAPADNELVAEFYQTVRKKFFSLRYPLSVKKISAARADRPEEKALEATAYKVTYMTPKDPDRDIAAQSATALWQAMVSQCQRLQTLVTAAPACNRIEAYLPEANAIVQTHARVLRLASRLPWANVNVGQRLYALLQAFYDRLEDFGWRCEAGEAKGLQPASAAHLARFVQAFKRPDALVLFTDKTTPASWLETVVITLERYHLQNDQLVLKPKPVAVADEKVVAERHPKRKSPPQKQKSVTITTPVIDVSESAPKRMKLNH